MTRSIKEWQGKTPDTPVPPRVRLRVLEKFKGRCQCGCDRKIMIGEAWQLDHILALINGGEHRESNLQPLLTAHHKTKTRADVALKSKNYARRAKHYGAKGGGRSRWAYGKDSAWKKKISGEVVRRG